MSMLQLALKARAANYERPVATLYRAIAKEIPRVLTIYDIDVPIAEARQCIREKFRDNAHVKDERVIDMLVEKGYMDLEEALLQFKQRPHLLSMLQGDKKSYAEVVRKRPTNIDELFMRS